jgi:hypothetical protein
MWHADTCVEAAVQQLLNCAWLVSVVSPRYGVLACTEVCMTLAVPFSTVFHVAT